MMTGQPAPGMPDVQVPADLGIDTNIGIVCVEVSAGNGLNCVVCGPVAQLPTTVPFQHEPNAVGSFDGELAVEDAVNRIRPRS